MPAPQYSGREFYSPKPSGQSVADYDRLQAAPELPGVAPPGGSVGLARPAMIPAGEFDPGAPDVLALIQGGRFRTPFTVTLMRRDGVQVFKSDAGQKTEANFTACTETIREPADLLRLVAGVSTGIYKPLNSLTLEFQLMLYLALNNGALVVPDTSASTADKGTITSEESVE